MISKIAHLIHLKSEPVAVIRAEQAPEGALQFREGVWGCVVSMLAAAARGRTAAFREETTACPGGRVGLGFCRFEPGTIEYFLSTGGRGPKKGEFYKKSPELARSYIAAMPELTPRACVVFRPLAELPPQQTPESVVFLVNADQLSALVTLANYDSPAQDNVQVRFGAGCAQAVLYPGADAQAGCGSCTIGLTDPSARKCISPELLSFSIPWNRFLELEAAAEESFLTRETWQQLAGRI